MIRLTLLAVAVALVGSCKCGSSTETVSGSTSTSASPVASSAASPMYAASASFVGEGMLPADFPRNVPMYPGAKIASANGASARVPREWTVTLQTTDSAEQVMKSYPPMLAGFTTTADHAGAMGRVLRLSDGTLDVTLSVAPGATPKSSNVFLGVRTKSAP